MTTSEKTKSVSLLGREFWNERYLSGNTGWDIGGVSTPIKDYADQLADKDIDILIPGCGNAYEAEYLSSKGFRNIDLIDISDVLTEKLQQRFRNVSNVNVQNIDFFELEGKYDLIIEQTFFCALHPSQRMEYVRKSKSILKKSGKIIGVLFDREFEKDGPPYGGNRNEYEEIFRKEFEIKTLESCYNSVSPRAGTEIFINLRKK